MYRLVCTLFMAMTLGACSTPTSKDMAGRWVDKDIRQAIAELGPPQNTTQLPGGVTIYTWETTYGSANAPTRGVCRTGLHTDAKGKIIDASQFSGSLLCK